jgi:hypothetical protein
VGNAWNGMGDDEQAMVAMDSKGEEEHCPMMKGEFEKDKGKHAGFANLTTISGTVKSVNLTRMGIHSCHERWKGL